MGTVLTVLALVYLALIPLSLIGIFFPERNKPGK